MAVALLALLVALFALVALVAVYARLRALEAGREVAVSGYAPLIGSAAPVAVHPAAGQDGAVVAVLDADCALCHEVWAALDALGSAGHRLVAVVDRRAAFAEAASHAELVDSPDLRAALFEGYAPTLLALDATGRIRARSFVYADTDLAALLGDLPQRIPS
jgi:hypothetical protein